MFSSTVIIAAATLSGLASAQNYSTSGPLTVVPDSVPYVLRQSWCRAQQNSCPLICGGQAFPNSCDANTLDWTCTCTDGSKPNISAYDQTMPSLVCSRWKDDCVAAHPNDLSGQTKCLSVECGMKNVSALEKGGSGGSGASSSAVASSASSTGKSAASSSSGGASQATNTGNAAAVDVAMNYGTGILAGGMLALFGLVL